MYSDIKANVQNDIFVIFINGGNITLIINLFETKFLWMLETSVK